MSKPAVHFCSFGSPPQYSAAMARIERDARESGYFDSVTVYQPTTVPGLEAHHKFIHSRWRGYGYWIWKPLVILDVMARATTGSIVVYADAGCGICTTPAARETFETWKGVVQEHPTHRIAFMQTHIEKAWCKAETAAAMKAGPEILAAPQAAGGIQMLVKTPENEALMREWLDWMTRDGYRYVTDRKSLLPNPIEFIEHRHDQAIISILMKQRGAAHVTVPGLDPVHPILCLHQRDS